VESRNAERVRLRAERDKLRATDPQGLADAWAMIDDAALDSVAAKSADDLAAYLSNTPEAAPAAAALSYAQ